MVKDMIFNREADNRIYDTAYTVRSDGYCKVNDTAFCSFYVDTTNLNHPTAIITSYDKIDKTQTNGSAQVAKTSNAQECKCVYLEDNKVAFIYNDNSTRELFVKIGTISGTTISFGAESADLCGGVYLSYHFEAVKTDATHIVVFGVFDDGFSNIVHSAVAVEITGTTISSIGTILDIDTRLSQIVENSEIAISAFNSSNLGVVWLNDSTSITSTVKIELSGVTLGLNQTPLAFNSTNFYPYPAIGCLNDSIAIVGYTPDSRDKNQNLELIDYSGDIPEIIYTQTITTGKNIWWRFMVVSDGSIVAVADARDTFEVGLWIINIYGLTYQINYVHLDVYFADKISFGITQMNEGEMIVFLDDYSGAAPTTYNVDANLMSFLGGVSMPLFLTYGSTLNYGNVETGESKTETVMLQNDGLYPEDINIECTSFYLTNDSNEQVREADIRVNSLNILNDSDYNYLTDPKGNILIIPS